MADKTNDNPNIVIKDRDGNPVTYENVPAVRVYKEDGTHQDYVAGKTADIIVDDLNFFDGDVEINPEGGEWIGKVTIRRPESLRPENIVEGAEVAGIPGAHICKSDEETVIDVSDMFNKTITAVTGLSASSIPQSAFQSCTSLVTASFPNCVSIGNNAFYSCTSLESVYAPYVSVIGASAFQGCSKLTEIDFITLSSIPNCAFSGCFSVSHVNLKNVTYIGSSAFYLCRTLGKADFPYCTYLSGYAFAECRKLSQINLPICLSIYNTAFLNCSSLESVYLPACKTIGQSAFSGCANLSTVSLPVISQIQSRAFNSCTNLISVYLLSTSYATLTSSTVFSYTPLQYSSYTGAYGSIFVRESMLSSYITMAIFSYFSSRFVGLTDDEIAALDAAREEETE